MVTIAVRLACQCLKPEVETLKPESQSSDLAFDPAISISNLFIAIMEAKFNQFSSLSQKDKGPAFISLISEILSQSDAEVSKDLHTLVDTVVNQDNVGLVVGRQVLSELVKVLGEGAIKDLELRKRVVVDTLATVQPRIVSYEEQVSLLSRLCNCEGEPHTC